MPEQRWSGHWWRDGVDESVPGTLVVDETGYSTLDLIGGFPRDSSPETPTSIPEDHPLESPISVIFGRSMGRKITLWRSIGLQLAGTPGRPQAQKLSVQRVLIGDHVRPTDEVFVGASVQLEHLGTWLGWPDLQRSSDDQLTSFTASLRSQEHGTATYNGWSISADTWVNHFHFERRRAGDHLTAITSPRLRLRPESPRTADDFDSLIHSLSDLLTLASGDPSGIVRMTFTAESEPGRQPSVIEAYGPRIHTAQPDAAAASDYEHRFTCLDAPYEQQIKLWLEIRDKAASACNVHFGASYARAGYTETRLLLHAIAAESLHAALYPDAKRVSKSQASRARETMQAANLDEEVLNWALEQLGNNRPTFKQRLLELAELPSTDAVRFIIRDVQAWAVAIVRARNGLAHEGSHSSNLSLFYLEWVTSGLIALVFMHVLGLPEEAQLRAARNVLRFPGGPAHRGPDA